MSDSTQNEDNSKALQKYSLLCYKFSAILKMYSDMSDEEIAEIGGRHIIIDDVSNLVKEFDKLKFKQPINPSFDDAEEEEEDAEELKQEVKILNKKH